MEGEKENMSAKRIKGRRPKQIQIDSSYKLVEARARVHNEFCATYNKLVSPLLRDIREKQLTGKLTSDILASYKKNMLVARQKLEETQQQVLLKYKIGKIQNETLANAIPMHIDTARWLERLPDWYLNRLEERQAQLG